MMAVEGMMAGSGEERAAAGAKAREALHQLVLQGVQPDVLLALAQQVDKASRVPKPPSGRLSDVVVPYGPRPLWMGMLEDYMHERERMNTMEDCPAHIQNDGTKGPEADECVGRLEDEERYRAARATLLQLKARGKAQQTEPEKNGEDAPKKARNDKKRSSRSKGGAKAIS